MTPKTSAPTRRSAKSTRPSSGRSNGKTKTSPDQRAHESQVPAVGGTNGTQPATVDPKPSEDARAGASNGAQPPSRPPEPNGRPAAAPDLPRGISNELRALVREHDSHGRDAYDVAREVIAAVDPDVLAAAMPSLLASYIADMRRWGRLDIEERVTRPPSKFAGLKDRADEFELLSMTIGLFNQAFGDLTRAQNREVVEMYEHDARAAARQRKRHLAVEKLFSLNADATFVRDLPYAEIEKAWRA